MKGTVPFAITMYPLNYVKVLQNSGENTDRPYHNIIRPMHCCLGNSHMPIPVPSVFLLGVVALGRRRGWYPVLLSASIVSLEIIIMVQTHSWQLMSSDYMGKRKILLLVTSCYKINIIRNSTNCTAQVMLEPQPHADGHKAPYHIL